MAARTRSLALLALLCSGSASAVPRLRLSNTVVLAQEAADLSIADQTLIASNIGDGTLSLSISIPPSVQWVTASVGEPQSCASANPCLPLRFRFSTAGLSQGTYTTFATVSDPKAEDAPQVISVTVQAGTGGIARVVRAGTDDYINFYGGPGGTGCGSRFGCPPFDAAGSTDDGGTWMAISVSRFDTLGLTWTACVRLSPQSTIAPGAYTGRVAITNGDRSDLYSCCSP